MAKELKPFDKILVRNSNKGYWIPALYGFKSKDMKHNLTSAGWQDECIPYEGNEEYLGTNKDYVCRNFPEIVESEDEKIWKQIKMFIISHSRNESINKIDSWLAWLEKQGEQTSDKVKIGKKYRCCNSVRYTCFQIGKVYEVKDSFDAAMISLCSDYFVLVDDSVEQNPDDKVEPKFKIGDWVVHNKANIIFQVVSIGSYGYKVINRDNYTRAILFDNKENYHLWTIQDAKDGDVLCTYECGKPKIVFILKGAPEKPYVLGYHCFYNIMYPHFEFDSEKGCLAPNEEDVKPATKEQRDLLFQKMKDAGYEWDAEKKELKKIEQKTAWSEEDEEYLKAAIWYAENPAPNVAKNAMLVEWVKNLKGRVQPQPKQEWSEEDEENKKTLRFLAYENCDAEDASRLITWLENLKEQILHLRAVYEKPAEFWKPTKEQIKALDYLICCLGESGTVTAYDSNLHCATALLQDLKKMVNDR